MSSVVALLWGALGTVYCHVKGKPPSHNPQSLEMGIPCQPNPYSSVKLHMPGAYVAQCAAVPLAGRYASRCLL